MCKQSVCQIVGRSVGTRPPEEERGFSRLEPVNGFTDVFIGVLRRELCISHSFVHRVGGKG